MAKTRYGIATQTLPNGYGGLPLERSCPHVNACLTCPVFLTGPEFLPELRQQRTCTLTLIHVSRGNGHSRTEEMNQRVLANLDRIIGEIETDQQRTPPMRADNSHLAIAAARPVGHHQKTCGRGTTLNGKVRPVNHFRRSGTGGPAIPILAL